MKLLVQAYHNAVEDADFVGFDEAAAGNREYATVLYRARFFHGIMFFVQSVYNMSLCKMFGHKIEVDANIGPESGSEDLYCARCGYSQHIRYY